ncbi:MAG: GspH/FimT family pseudopilin [Candidatus Aminicenantes bacterium]
MSETRKGFTLLEAMVLICITGMLLGIAGLAMVHRSPRYHLDKAAWEIYSRLNQARFRAVLQHRKVKVTFTSTGYIMEEFDEEAGNWKKFNSRTLEAVKVEANNTPIFHPRGTVSNLASIYVSNSGGRVRISLAMSGRLKVIPM